MLMYNWVAACPSDAQFERDFAKCKNKLPFDPAWRNGEFLIPPVRPVNTIATTVDPETGTRYVIYYPEKEGDHMKHRRAMVAKRKKS